MASARTKRGNAFEALMWFPDFGMLHLWKDSRTKAPTPTILEDVLSDYTWSLIRWRGVCLFHHLLRKSLSHVAFLPLRDGASYSQATTTTPLSLSVLTFPFRIDDIRSFDVNMELFTYSTTVPRAHRVARYRHLVLMVEVERRNWLTIHIPYSRVTYDIRQIRLKNEALSPSARISATDLTARSPLQFNARASKEILLGSKHDWAHSRRLVDRSKRVIFTPTVYPRVVE